MSISKLKNVILPVTGTTTAALFATKSFLTTPNNQPTNIDNNNNEDIFVKENKVIQNLKDMKLSDISFKELNSDIPYVTIYVDDEGGVLEKYSSSHKFQHDFKYSYKVTKNNNTYLALFDFGGENIGVYNLNNPKDKLKVKSIYEMLTKKDKNNKQYKPNIKEKIMSLHPKAVLGVIKLLNESSYMGLQEAEEPNDSKIKQKIIESNKIKTLDEIESSLGTVVSESRISNERFSDNLSIDKANYYTYVKDFYNKSNNLKSTVFYFGAEQPLYKSGIAAACEQKQNGNRILTFYNKKGVALQSFDLNSKKDQQNLDLIFDLIPGSNSLALKSTYSSKTIKDNKLVILDHSPQENVTTVDEPIQKFYSAKKVHNESREDSRFKNAKLYEADGYLTDYSKIPDSLISKYYWYDLVVKDGYVYRVEEEYKPNCWQGGMDGGPVYDPYLPFVGFQYSYICVGEVE